MAARSAGLGEFYPFYLSEHRNATCRRLHFAGSTLVLVLIAAALATGAWWLLWLVPIAGYGFAPLQLTGDLNFPAMFHGVDERVPLDALAFGRRVLADFFRYC